MKNTTIIKAWDAVNPTDAQKKRMRAALEARLNGDKAPSQSEAGEKLDFTLPVPEKTGARTKKPRPQYQSVQPAKSRGSVFAVLAAVLAVVIAGGLFLGVMNGVQGGNPSYAAPTETEPVTAATEAMELPEAYQKVIDTYVTAIKEGWNPAQCSEAGISILTPYVESQDDLGYALMDLSGNQTEELLITNGQEIYSFYSLSPEGEAVCWFTSMDRSAYYLSKGSMIVHVGSGSAATTYYEFCQFRGIRLDKIFSITFDPDKDPKTPWFHGDHEEKMWPITEDDANTTIEAYPHLYIPHITLSGETPMTEVVPDAETLKKYARQLSPLVSGTGKEQYQLYCFYDFNEDGETELLLGTGNAIHTVLIPDGQGSVLVNSAAGYQIYFCQNGILEYTGDEDGRTYYQYERVQDGIQVDYVATDGKHWYTQNGDTISEEEAQAIRAKYKHLNLPWKNISEFPVSIPEASGEHISTLFDEIFLPIASDGVQLTRGELVGKMKDKGFVCEVGGEIVMCWDPDISGADLGAVFTTEGDSGMINLLNYVLPGEVCRLVQVEWEGGEIRYHASTDVDNRFSQGVWVDSVKELQDFLLAEEETLQLLETAEDFAVAYFLRSEDKMLEQMVSSQTSISDMFSGNRVTQIEKIIGLEDAEAHYIQNGSATVSAAAYIDSQDSYTYLTMKMVKENGQWKVSDYWLEK